MPATTIAVYHDAGSGEFSRGCLVHALEHALAGRAQVRRILAQEICASDAWHAGTRLLALPGGADVPYAQRLNGAGNASIRRYLEAGGALLGMCAGAYYAAARVSFEPSTPGAVTAARELALFAGTAHGSLHDLAAPYALEHLRCAAAIRVSVAEPPPPTAASLAGAQLAALYWGGPEFLPDPGSRYTPLLHYVRDTRTRSLAAVSVPVGKGRAVLSGVHAEVMGAQFAVEVARYADDSFVHGMRASRELCALERERSALFQLLLAALELE